MGGQNLIKGLSHLCNWSFTDVKQFDNQGTTLYLGNNFPCSRLWLQPATSNLQLKLVSRREF